MTCLLVIPLEFSSKDSFGDVLGDFPGHVPGKFPILFIPIVGLLSMDSRDEDCYFKFPRF